MSNEDTTHYSGPSDHTFKGVHFKGGQVALGRFTPRKKFKRLASTRHGGQR